MYSNVQGDFVATPVVGTKRITFSDFANNVISGDLSALNFIKSEVYEVLASGTVVKLPTTSLNYSSEQGLTLLEMVGNFKADDQVAVYIQGRDKGFDEENDAYKITGAVVVDEEGGAGGAGTSATSSAAANDSSTLLLDVNAARLGATIFNESTVPLYLKLGEGASLIDYTVKIGPDQYYEVPFKYTGIIEGIWPSVTGNARITELTP
jgi:hypothetical protein